MIVGLVVVFGAGTQLWVPIAQANQLLMAPMNEPEGLAPGVPALASAELAARAMPKTTDSVMRFMISSSRCAAKAAWNIDGFQY